MRNLALIVSAAAMAVAMPALAEGNGKEDKGHKGHKSAEHHKDHSDRKAGDGHKGKRHAKARHERKHDSIARAENRRESRLDRIDRHERRSERAERRDDREDRREARLERRALTRFAGQSMDCPPGLAKKNNGCLPPGQVRKRLALGQPFVRVQNVAPDNFGYSDWYGLRDRDLPIRYRNLYSDSSDYYYRYDEGNIYRVASGSNLVAGLIPLLGGGFSTGQALPLGYDIYNVPLGYRDIYRDTDDSYYRYGDNAIYRVDPQTRTIQGIAALLTGDLAVGQPLPMGYDVYNVPLNYRDQYPDTNDAMYRYADGNIYQIDPTTRLIQAAIQLLL